MKTAVEWYNDAINKIVIARIHNEINDELFIQNLLNAKLQAKQLEKEQIETAFSKGEFFSSDYFDPNKPSIECCKNYYNKTFNLTK
jgi:hypothetical protein